MFLRYLLLLVMTVTSVVAGSQPKWVFAHFIAGVASGMTDADWTSDIQAAKDAHIDGFALNIATQDSYTDAVLEKAYTAAAAVGNFSLFLSFDYASGGPWPMDRVITTVNTYKNKPAQFYYQGKPLVSTFEGTSNVNDWASIKAATGCFFIPSWTSLGPTGFAADLDKVDGGFSWDAWPVGAEGKTTDNDQAWIKALAGKPYMMPVAPWFYTNLPQWDKNWLWRGDDLWFDRWQQVIELQPDFVEIITWNDYGEAHYIGPIHSQGIPQGASSYVVNNPHDAWRTLLPVYIDAYKSGNATQSTNTSSQLPTRDTTSPTKDTITYWYRLNPSNSGSSGGTTGNNPSMGQPALNPAVVSEDKVFLTVFVLAPSQVTVQIGGGSPTTLQANVVGTNHFSVPFNGQTGPVTFTILCNGQQIVTTTGPAITNECSEGKINWNAYVGSSNPPQNGTTLGSLA
jgi:hypothetical protein